MKNKKLLGLLIGLAVIAVCFAVVLVLFGQPSDQPEATEPDTTAPVTTEPVTEPVTEPDTTEPTTEAPVEETTEAPTEEPTEPTTQSGNNINNGSGGGYAPGTTDPTEPETTEPPVIEVPEAGAENNPYYEQLSEPYGEFSTVKLSAGQTVSYALQTAGSYITVEDPQVSVVLGETTYNGGNEPIALPESETGLYRLQFVNNSSESKYIAVSVLDALGSQTNPFLLSEMKDFTASVKAEDTDGVYYSWTAPREGVLVLTADETVDLTVTVGETEAKLSEDADRILKIALKQADAISLQVTANADSQGNIPAVEAGIRAYFAPYADLTAETVPGTYETVSIPAGQSVFYRISGASGNVLQVENASVQLWYHAVQYTADENGVIAARLDKTEAVSLVEVVNTAQEAAVYTLQFGYPLGHPENPHTLTQLGELKVAAEKEFNGYHYRYTAENDGVVTFQVWEWPADETAATDIILTNTRSGETGSLWTAVENGEPVANDMAKVNVKTGDEITIWVKVTGDEDCIDSELVIFGAICGTEDAPILIQYPGFTAHVPAGKTLHYYGYNMNDLIFTLTGENVIVLHDQVAYTAQSGKLQLSVVASSRTPAVFAITNTGDADAAFPVVLAYPVGHSENPDNLLLGNNTVTREEGKFDYCLNFTAPRAGELTFTFPTEGRWYYVVNNLTQMIYGDIQYSDSNPLANVYSLTVAAGDKIQICVNTYDPANPGVTPAGIVSFTASYVTGPVQIETFAVATKQELLAGESGLFTGDFYGFILKISNAPNAVVTFKGQTYPADASGNIKVEFPEGTGGELRFTLHNGSSATAKYSLSFVSKAAGSYENPEILTVGSYTMVQDMPGGPDHYYRFTAPKNGTLIITFETDVDCIYMINSTYYYTHMGRNTYRISVPAGRYVLIAVNTYDQRNPMVSPEGEINFTVEFR